MKKRTIIFALVLALVLALLSGCGGKPESAAGTASPAAPAPAAGASSTPADTPQPPTGDPVKIGMLGHLSGGEAYVCLAAKAALEDYIEELNAQGGLLGRPLELVVYDYSIDAATEAVSATNRFIQQDHVVAIIGPYGSTAAIPMIPLVAEAKVPVIATAATNPKVTVDEDTGELNEYMFRICFIDPYQGEALAGFAYKQGLRKVATLTEIGNPYSAGLLDYFTETFTALGGEVVMQEGYQHNDVEFRAQVSNAAANGADTIFMPATNYRDAGLVSLQARDLGLEFTYLFGDGIYSQELLDVAEGALDGAFMTNAVSEDDPAFAEYRDQFAARHPGNSANIYVYYTLDAMMLLEWAIRDCGSFDGEAIKNSLESAVNVPLFTESLTMDPATHNPLNKSVSIIQIVDSEYVLFETFKPEE